MGRFHVLIAVLVLAFVGCAKKQPVDKVTSFASDDPHMNAAIEKARSTVGKFIAALKSPKPGQSAFSVKMAFTEGAEIEHMWLNQVSYDGANFHGVINNEPQSVKTVKIGQKATVAPAKISDWMYLENRKLVGGATLRVMRDTLTPAERADFDKSLPFVIE